jgi:hypothetical protein
MDTDQASERADLLGLIERHEELREWLKRYTRAYYLERVRAFYRGGLGGAEAERVADQLFRLELHG